MKNRKVYAMICWGISIIFILSSFLMSDGTLENMTKHSLFWIILGIIWMILGIFHWIHRKDQSL